MSVTLPSRVSAMLKSGAVEMTAVLRFQESPHFYTMRTVEHIPGAPMKDGGEWRAWLGAKLTFPTQGFDEFEWFASNKGITFSLLDYDGSITSFLADNAVVDHYVELWLVPWAPQYQPTWADALHYGKFVIRKEATWEDGWWTFQTDSNLSIMETPIPFVRRRLEVTAAGGFFGDDIDPPGGKANIKHALEGFPQGTSYGTNLDFEDTSGGGSPPPGWTLDSGTISRSNAAERSGTYGAICTSASGSGQISQIMRSSGVAVGQQYACSVFTCKSSLTGESWDTTVTVEGLDGGGGIVESDTVTNGNNANWQANQVRYTVGDASVTQIRLKIYVVKGGAGTARDCYIDDVTFGTVYPALHLRQIFGFVKLNKRLTPIGGGVYSSLDGLYPNITETEFETYMSMLEGDEIYAVRRFYGHPLACMLQLLLSTDTAGSNHATYDLGFGGAGLDPDDFDITGIEALMSASNEPWDGFSDYYMEFRLIDRMENPKRFVETHIMPACGARLYVNPSTGKISVAIFGRPVGGEDSTITLKHSDFIGGKIKLTRVKEKILNEVRVKYDHDDGGFVDNAGSDGGSTRYMSDVLYTESTFDESNTQAADDYKAKSKTFELMGTRGSRSIQMGLMRDRGGDDIADNLARMMFQRRRAPLTKYDGALPLYLGIGMIPGERYRLESDSLPDLKRGTVGFENVTVEAVEVKPRLQDGQVDVTLHAIGERADWPVTTYSAPGTPGANDWNLVALTTEAAEALGIPQWPERAFAGFILLQTYGAAAASETPVTPTFTGYLETEIWIAASAGGTLYSYGAVRGGYCLSRFLTASTAYVKIRYKNKNGVVGSYSAEKSIAIAAPSIPARFSQDAGFRRNSADSRYAQRYK